MTLADITAHVQAIPVQLSTRTVNVFKSTHRFNPAGSPNADKTQHPDNGKRIFAAPNLDSLIEQNTTSDEEQSFCKNNDFSFYGTGWQSWGFGGETMPGTFEQKYIPLIPQFKKYITMPGGKPVSVYRSKEKLLVGHFICYFRWNDTYLVVASTGNSHPSNSILPKSVFGQKKQPGVQKSFATIQREYEELISNTSFRTPRDDLVLPPVEFTIDRKNRILSCSVDAFGKVWKQNELIAELSIFCAHGYFELKEMIQKLYGTTAEKRFTPLAFLNTSSAKLITGGWESWYNRYSNISQTYIQNDLSSLGSTDNFIKKYFIDDNKPTIFQIDDGWEQGVGQWEPDRKRFPAGLNALATTISMQGYIPGLWIAPFVIDWRTDFCTMHTQWILRNEYGTPIEAGFNLSWGSVFGQLQPGLPFSFYCLDLSNEDVIEYLDSLMDRVINEWGFRYIKLDFLYAGMLQGKFVNGGTAYQWYNSALRILTSRKTNVKGQHVMYLGCGMPFESSFNYLPLSRIGPDTKEDWDLMLMKRLHFSGRTGAVVNLQSTLGHAFWDQSIFINDPDVIFMRNTNITLMQKEKELIALVNFLFASQIMYSDDPEEFAVPDEHSFTQHIISLYHKFSEEEFGLVNKTSTVYYIASKSAKFCGIINLSDVPYIFNRNELTLHSSRILSGSTDCFTKNTILNPVVNHCVKCADPNQNKHKNKSNNIGSKDKDFYSAESHSITIFSTQPEQQGASL